MTHKYRAWDGKQMHVGFTLSYGCIETISGHEGYVSAILKFTESKTIVELADIDDLVWMSSTGLPDINGKESFDGDRIRIEHGECVGHDGEGNEIWIPIEGVILFEDGMFVFDSHSCGTLPLHAYKDSFEVIGIKELK